jgi:hypothetical protein
MNLTFELTLHDFKAGFINTTMKRAQDGTQRGLMYMGGYIRRIAKNSIKTAARHSQKNQQTFIQGHAGEVYSRPGQPPLSKLGLLRDFILYRWDPIERCVIIGPAKLSRQTENVPAILEHGGFTRVTIGKGAKRRQILVKIEPRPYMRPALEVAMRPENIARFFRNFMDAQGQTLSVAA